MASFNILDMADEMDMQAEAAAAATAATKLNWQAAVFVPTSGMSTPSAAAATTNNASPGWRPTQDTMPGSPHGSEGYYDTAAEWMLDREDALRQRLYAPPMRPNGGNWPHA